MNTKQQLQTRDYFKKFAEEWGLKAQAINANGFNVIRERNKFVMDVARENAPINLFLDVGCGTGDLVIQTAEIGINSVGIDFAEEMIKEANKKKEKLNCKNEAAFIHSSIFDFPMRSKEYDLISANGFIEYISFEELESFFDMVAKGIKIGGSFVCGSRNRLFNLFSLNDYTLYEIESEVVSSLLAESVLWATSSNLKDVVDNCKIIQLQEQDMRHPTTGIEVTSRFQYTPVQLIKMLERRGFSIVEVYPVNIHGINPKLNSVHPDLYAFIANSLQPFARNNTSTIMQASTFMLHVKKLA